MSEAPVAHLGIRDLALVAARAIATEVVLFEAFGRWIPTTSEASVKPLLAAASLRHARHAQLWRERFPVIPDTDVDESLVSAHSELGPLVDALEVFDALPSGPGRLAVADLAATGLGRAYRTALAPIDPLLDAPTARLLMLVVADLEVGPTPSSGLTDDERIALDALDAAAPFRRW